MECLALSLHFVRNNGMTLNIKLVDTFLSYLLEIMLYLNFIYKKRLNLDKVRFQPSIER